MLRRATVVFMCATALVATFGCTSYLPLLNQVGLLPGPPASLLLGALTGGASLSLTGSSSSSSSLGSLASSFLSGSSSSTSSTSSTSSSTTSTTSTNSTSSSTSCPSGQTYVGTVRGVVINACVATALAQQYGAS